jgi:RNA polymerase sigma-70 factor (ECF subfamily)
MMMSSADTAGIPEYERELKELLSKIARGCESALGRLYDRTIAQVYGLALKILGNRTVADEVSVDVFKQIWDKAFDYAPDRGTPTAWLITLTKSRSIDRLRSDTKRRSREDPLHDDIPSPADSPDECTETREERALIDKALSELTPKQRESIELAYFHGLTQTEISNRMNEPLGTVKSWMRAGMIRLREIIGPGDS